MKTSRLLVLLSLLTPIAYAVPQNSPAASPASTISLLPILVQTSTMPIHEEVPDAHGGFFLVWGDSAPITGAQLFGKHLDAHGKSLGEFNEILLVPQVETLQDWMAFPDGWGGLALTWVAAGQLHVQRFNDALKSLIHDVVLSRQSPKRPAGIPGDGGALDLVWAENQSENRHVLKAQRIDADGRIIWTEGGIPFSTAGSLQTRTRMQSDGAGGFVAAWYDYRESKDQSRLKIQRLNIAGQLMWGSGGRTVTAPVLDPTPTPALESLGEGRVVVGWNAPEANALRFFTQAFELTGEPVNQEAPRAISAIPIDNGEVLLYGDEGGTVWVAWTDWRNEQNWSVLLKRLPPTGEAVWKKPAVFSDYVEDERFPALASDHRDGIFGVWVGNRLGKVGLYAQLIDADGDAQWGEYGRLVAYAQHSHRPRLEALAAGQALLVWTDQPQKDVWTLNGALLNTGPEPDTTMPTALKK